MRTLDVNEPIALDDGRQYQFVEHGGGVIRLRDTATGEPLDMHMAELSRRVIGLPPATARPARTLDELNAANTAGVSFWAGHIREVLSGSPVGAGDPRQEYDPSTTLESRVQLKLAELKNAGIDCSRPTLMRKIKAYRESGTAGLIDGRALRRHGPLDRLDPRVLDALSEVMAEQLYKSTGTRGRIIVETHKRLLLTHGADAPAMPSEASMYRYITLLDRGRHTTGSARTRQSAGQRPDRTFAKRIQTLPGAEVQVDSTLLDVFVRTEKGKPKRPTLTIMVDVASRSILASTLRLGATKGIDHVTLLAQALIPPANRPERELHRARVHAANPQFTFKTTEERRRLEATRPFVYPRRIMMDNGKDYISENVRAAAEQFGIDITMSAPYTPTGKSIVERTFGSINTLFTQYLPGYTGRSPEFRGLKVEADDLLDIHGLYELFDDWVLDVWQNRPHKGLRHRFEPSVLHTPNQMVAAAARVAGTLLLPITEDTYLELLPSTFLPITSTGVTRKGREYDSPELHPLRGTKSARAGKKGKWEVKYDPYNDQTVWVRSPEGHLIECARRDGHWESNPFSQDVLPTNSEREEAARTNAAVTGTPMHRPPVATPVERPSDFPDEQDDTDDSPMTPFNHED